MAPEDALVGVLDQQDSIGALAVTACPTRLLIILLQGIGNIHMNHKTNVRLVDTHAESIGCHHHAALVAGPLGLLIFLVLDIEPRMVIVGMNACMVEFVADLLCALAGTHIHNCSTGY